MGADRADRERRADRIVGAWRRQGEQGFAPTPAEVVAAHPDLADELREAFDALALLEGAFPEASRPGDAGEPHPPGEAPGGRSNLETIGDFHILRELGRGGMGVVYEAEQVSMGRRVALKVLFPSVTLSPKAVERFRREAQATGRLHHTNVVQVHGMGFEDGHWYYAMELVRGRALGDLLDDVRRLRGRPATPSAPAPSSSASEALRVSTGTGRREEFARIARMFAGVAEALAAAHAAGVVHRDVKPSNLMLDEEGTLKILDFGLASMQEEPSGLTRTGDVIGTPAYMSPEQASGRPVDARADVYSLGATLYEVLTLHPVVRGRDLAETLRRIHSRSPTPPRRLEPRIPRDLETIVLKTLEREPARRYATAADLARDLHAFADGFSIAARRAGPLGRAWRLARRHPGRTALVAALALAIGGAAWLAVLNARDAAERRDRDYQDLLARAQEAELRPGDEAGHEFSDELYAKAIALAPDRPEAWYLRGLTQGAPETREADLRAAAERGLPERTLLLARAFLRQEQGRPAEARILEEQATRAGPHRPEDAYLEGVLALGRGDLDAAVARFDESVAHEPRHGALRRRALGHLAQIHRRAGRLDQALQSLTSAWDPDSMPMRVALEVAALWRALGRSAEAEARFEGLLAQFGAGDARGDWYDALRVLWDGAAWDWMARLAERGLTHRPGDDVLVGYRALALVNQGRSAEALALCRAAIEAGSKHEMVWTTYARALRLTGDLPAAVEAGRKAVAHSGGRAQARLELAIALHLLGRFEDALQVLDEGVAAAPGEAPLHHWRGKALCALQRWDEGIASLRRAVELRTSDPLLVTTLADALAGAGRREERLAVLERATERFPFHRDFALTRIAALQDLGRAEDARAFAEALVASVDRELAVTPLRGPLHTLKVSLLGNLGRGTEALAAAEVGITAVPMETNLWVERGIVETASGRLADAERSFRKALELDPASTHAGMNLVPVLLQTGRAEEAYQVSEKVLQAPLHAIQRLIASYNRACALRVLGRRGQALAAFEAVLASAPSYGDAARNLAEMRMEAGDLPGAAAALGQIRDPMARSHPIHNLRAIVLARMGRPAEALPEIDAALRLSPAEPMYLQNRAAILEALGRREDAVAAFDAVLAVRPEEGDAHAGKCRALLSLGKAKEAQAAAVAGIAAAPRSAPVREVASQAEAALGNGEAAIRHLLDCVDLAPGNAQYANNAAWYLVTCPWSDLRDPAKAVVLAARATAAAPREAGFWNTYGYALLLHGDFREAVDALRRSGELDGGRDPTTGWFLAAAHARLGQPQEAHKALEAPERWWAEHPDERGAMEPWRRVAEEALGQGGTSPEAEK